MPCRVHPARAQEAKQYVDREEITLSTILVSKDKKLIGVLLISDILRDNVAEIISEAKASGISITVMMTGDREEVARTVGEQIGLDVVIAYLLPADKVEYINHHKEDGRSVLMVGDGINDAPALATADVGVAMGLSGTDIAIETAGITLASNRLEGIPKLLRIGRETMKIVKLNIAFALVVNAIGIILSAFGVVSPLIASIIHESNALLVMFNSLRLLNIE